MNLSILDTHRLPYRNAEFTAVALGTTTPVKFHDSDGNDLGYKVYTNSGGYICDSNGNLLGNGTFVGEDALVVCTYNGSQITQWSVKAQSNQVVNDGKLLDKNGMEIWSANSGDNLQLSYNDLADIPDDDPWDEREQRVNINVSGGGLNVNVNTFTKTLVLGTSLADKQFDVYLTPPAGRTAQVIFVQGAFDDDVYLNVFNAFDQQVGAEKICTIRGKENAMISLLSTRKYIKLETDKDLIIGGFVDGSENHVITDITPPVVQIRDGGTDVDETERFIFMTASQITKPRKVTLWWIPQVAGNENKPCRVMVQTGPATVEVALTLQPFRPCECLVFFDSTNNRTQIVPTGYLLQAEGPKLTRLDAPCTGTGNRYVSATLAVPASTSILYVRPTGVIQGTGQTEVIIPFKLPPNWKGDLLIQTYGELMNGPDKLTRFKLLYAFMCNGAYCSSDPDDMENYAPKTAIADINVAAKCVFAVGTVNGTDARYSTDMSSIAELDDNSRIMVHVETFDIGGIVFFYDYRKQYIVNPPWEH